MSVNDADEREAVGSMVGHRIMGTLFYDENTSEWGDHGTVEITLDDGRVFKFTSTGYDASDVHVGVGPMPSMGTESSSYPAQKETPSP